LPSILLLSLIPSVGIIAYYHGKSGLDRWLKAERIIVPANVVMTILILFFMFKGRDLGAATKEVSLVDEDGNTVQRILPKNQYIKNLAVFNFENYSGDKDLDWLSSGINLTILSDFGQDQFFRARGTPDFYEELKRKKIERLDQVPFQLKRNISRLFGMEYILAGGYDKTGEEYKISTELYEAESGRLISEHSIKGPNMFDLVDDLTVKIKEDIEIPTVRIKEAVDLKVADIFTSSMPALRDFTLGFEIISYERNFPGGISPFSSALEKDPEFVMAEFNLGIIFMAINQVSTATVHMEKVMDKLYMLPERSRYLAKSFYYLLKEDFDRRVKVLEMWKELYPEDLEAYQILFQIYSQSGQPQKGEAILKSALQYDDNRGNFYVDLANVLMTQNKKDEALAYYQLYAEKYPDHARSFRLLGDFYFDEGDNDQAEKYYEKALLISDDDIICLSKIGLIRERQGRYEEAQIILENALKTAGTPGDSMLVFNSQIEYFLHRGQIQSVINIWDQFLETARRELPPISVSIYRITTMQWYFYLDQDEVALQIIKSEEKDLDDSFRDVISFGYMNYYCYKEELENAEREFTRVKNYSLKYGSPGNIVTFYEGELFWLKGDDENALNKYMEFKKGNIMVPGDLLDIKISNAYLALDQPDEAMELIDGLLKINPRLAMAHLEKAKIFLEENKPEKAREHLQTALEIWSDADAGYTVLKEAKRLYVDL